MKSRKLYKDGIEESVVGPIKVVHTREGHTIEKYTLSNGKKRFFATLAGSHWCAHGSTIAEAVADAIWKDPDKRPSRESLVNSIRDEGHTRKITLIEFCLLTGACITGCRDAAEKEGMECSPITAHEIRDKISKEWGEKLLSLLGWEVVTS